MISWVCPTHHNYGGGVGHYETPHATSDVGDTVTDNTVPYDKNSASTVRGEQSYTAQLVTDNSFGLGGQNVAVAFERTDLSTLRDGELADLADAAAEEVGASGQVLHVPLVDLVGRGSDRLVVSGFEVLRPQVIEGADIVLVEKLLPLHRKPCIAGIFDDVLVTGHCAAPGKISLAMNRPGLSAASITRLTAQWQDGAKSFQGAGLSGTDFVYLWVDGIHLKVRLEQEKLCLLVMIGVRTDGRKELVTLSDGCRESSKSRADLLRGCRRRGMTAPVLAVGDGALGFWKALREVFPETLVNSAAGSTSKPMCLPHCQNRRTPVRWRRFREINNAEDIDKAHVAIKAFAPSTTKPSTPSRSRRSPTTPTCCWSSTRIRPSIGRIWSPRTQSNRTFATVRLRTKVTKGPGSRGAGIAMAYKLIDAAQARWRVVNAPHLVALVRAGATFHKGKLLERPTDITPDTSNIEPETAGSEVA